MLGVISSQEYQISTQDYHLMMEFQRDRRVNMIDLIDLKKQASKNEDQQVVKEVEIDAVEYMDLKARIHELEVLNNVLNAQVTLLNSNAIKKSGGTAKEVNKELFQIKLQNLPSQNGGVIGVFDG